MAVCIFINNTDKSLDSLDKADKYISHPSKIAPRGIVGSGCPPDQWVSSNRALKRFWHAAKKKQLRHIVIGFAPNDNVDNDKAARIALMIARLFIGYYVKCAVHDNTTHLHIHIIVGNTSYITGKQLDMSKTDLYRFKAECTKILRANGLYGIRMRHGRIDSFPDDVTDSELMEIPDEWYVENPGDAICESVESQYTADNSVRGYTGYPQYRTYNNFYITNNYFEQPGDYNITHSRSRQAQRKPLSIAPGHEPNPGYWKNASPTTESPLLPEAQTTAPDDRFESVIDIDSGGFFDKPVQAPPPPQPVLTEVRDGVSVLLCQYFQDRDQAMAWIMSQPVINERIRFYIDGVLVPFTNGDRIFPFIPI